MGHQHFFSRNIMFNFQNLPFFQNKEKATHSLIPSKYPERKNIPFFDTVRELCDNSVDAKATTINIILQRNQIFIIDNGCGMNNDVLNKSLISGNSGKTNKTNTLGKFGIGLNQSIAQFNKDARITQAHFLSLTWDEYFDKPSYSYIKISPEEINKNIDKLGVIDGWKIEPAIDLYRTEKNEIQRYLINLCSDLVWKDGPFQSGTIVGIIKTSIPELRTDDFEELTNELSCHLGMSYYNLISNKKLKINIRYNDIITPVQPIDFLLRNVQDVEVFLEKEYTHKLCKNPLKITIVVTPKDKEITKPHKDEMTKNSPFHINNDNNGISLQHNGVIINKGIKRIPITKSLETKIRASLKEKNKTTTGAIRDYIWWTSNDSYSSPIRTLIEIDSEWHINNLIKLDQEKTSFEFHEELDDILADLYINLNDAINHSKQKTKTITQEETITTTPIVTPTKTPTTKPTPAPKPTSQISSTPIIKTYNKNKYDLSKWRELSHEVSRTYDESLRAELFDFSEKLYKKIYVEE